MRLWRSTVVVLTANLTANRVLDALRRFRLQARQDVRVGVKRQADLRVAERFHDDTRVNSLGQQKRGCRVSQVVQSQVG